MNEKVLHTLEYNKILDQLTEYAFSADARSRCQKLRPITDRAQIEQLQQQTSDALSRLFKYGSLSFSGVTDIRDSLKRLEIGGALSAIELLRVCSLLESAKRAKAFARSQEDNDQPDDSLTGLFAGIEPLTPLCDEIRRCILSEDEIADDASSTLHSIRRSMRGMNDKIRAQMNSMISNTTTRSYLQDTVITMRDGRYCLPVKAEAKSLVPGMIHDQSSTGSTLFIEPMAVVNLNNEYKELQLREQEEIEVILAGLSNLTASYATQLLADYELLTELDFIFARAAFAQTYNGVAPLFNDDGRIHIRKGRHPLLDPKKVVPIDVRLGEDFRLLIVTGPNTGGKTVSLKTVGLLTLMGQSGLHIPASERSELGIFDEVFADIGDEQSIEQSLSTFSSHMVNIIRILEQVNDRSLVLFDELCAGTDPTEGAALAISILSKLHLYGARIMATTHYSELKVYALSTPGVENACCEFDVATLRPTYRLLVGIPGKSNAFAISERLGVPAEIIADARSRVGTESASFEATIEKLESVRQALERDRDEAERKLREAEENRKESAKIKIELAMRLEKAELKARRDAERIIAEARETAEAAFAEIDEMRSRANADEDHRAANEARAELRRRLNEAEEHFAEKPAMPEEKRGPTRPAVVGDTVELLSMGVKAEVVGINKDGSLSLRAGIMNVTARQDEVRVTEKQPKKKVVSSTGTATFRQAAVAPELDLRGMETLEAIPVMERYIDSAVMGKLHTVTIIHGKGTGALRQAVQQSLRKNKAVKSFRLGRYGEGETGVTVVELK